MTLTGDPTAAGIRDRLFIGGQFVDAIDGATFDDIVTMSVFLTDLRYIPEFNKLSKEIFKKNFPAVTFVEVSHLARPQLIMEIQPIAVIP